MKTAARVSMFLLALAAVAIVAAPAAADPLPGEFPKFVQKPMIETSINGTTYYGHDEYSTARSTTTEPRSYVGEFMADDFADRIDGEVVHVTWWGSYMNAAGVEQGVKQFLISFETDIPAGTEYPDGYVTDYSRPGAPILNQIVTLSATGAPTPGTFTETRAPYTTPVPAEVVYQYNAELACPFPQEANTTYWLKIVALLDADQDFAWGWHNRDYTKRNPYASPPEVPIATIPDPTSPNGTPIYHFQDDAVMGQMTAQWFGANPCEVEVSQDPFSMQPTQYREPDDGPGPIAGDPDFPGIARFSKDLAFVLYAVPEPSTLVLLALGLACLAGCRWWKK